MKTASTIGLLASGILLAGSLSGCVSQSKAKAEEQKAYRIGQQQAALEAEARRNNISVAGPVLRPIVPWLEGITLAQAIVTAHWTAPGDPHAVVLTRKGERVELTPNESVAAAQLPLEPGDQIELLP